MSNLDTADPHAVDGLVGITADCNYFIWIEQIDKSVKELAACVSFSGSMASIGHLIVRFMRVERKDVPKKHGLTDASQHSPDSVGGTFANWRPFGCPFNCQTMEQGAVSVQMHLVSQRKACSTATTITKIASNPDGPYV